MTTKGYRLVPVSEGWWDNMQEVCLNCDRRFNLLNVSDNEEWHFGHDCEEAS